MFHNAKRAIVYNAQDAKVSELAAEAQTAEGCRKVGFTLEAPQAGQIGIEDGWIVDRSGVAGGAAGESVRLAAITDSRIWQSRTAHCTRIWWPMH
mgnify:CR=1 FL=1